MYRDRGLTAAELAAPGLEAQVWASVQQGQAFARKGRRVSLCRWFAWPDAAAEFDSHWTSRLLVQLYLGLQQGWLQRAAGEHFALGEASTGTARGVEPAKERTAESQRSEVQRLRDRCTNTMHLATLFLLDEENQYKSRILFTWLRPVREWHAWQNGYVRSSGAARDFYVQCARGVYLEPLGATLRLLADPAAGHFCGLETEPSAACLQGIRRGAGAEEPAVLQQDRRAALRWRTAWAVVARRLRGMLWIGGGWPGQMALLAAAESAVQEEGLRRLQRAHLAFEAARAQAQTTTLKSILRKSPFQFVPMRLCVRLAETTAWRLPNEGLCEFARSAWSAIGQTKLVEDGFCRLRDEESRGQKSNVVRHDRQWASLVTTGLISETHSFTAVSTDGCPQQADLGISHCARLCDASLPGLGDLASERRAAPHVSFTPATWVHSFAEQALLEQCHASADWSGLSSCRLSGLLEEGLVVRRRDGADWWLCAAQLKVGALLWPLAAAGGFLQPRSVASPAELQFASVTNLEQWEALPSRPVSPLHCKLLAGPAAVCLQPLGSPVGLLAAAARAAFWQLGKGWLAQLARHLALETPGQSLCGLLLALVQHSLGCSEGEAAGLLEQRLLQRCAQEACMDLLQAEEAQECLESGDRKEAAAACAAWTAEAGEAEPFESALRALKARAGSAAVAAGEARGRGARRKSGAPTAPQAAAYPARFPEGEVPFEAARALAPPGYVLRRHSEASAYEVYYGRAWSVSRAWRLHTPWGALRLVLAASWRHHEARAGDPCPMAGLLR